MTLLIFAATALQIAEQVIPEGADAKLIARIVDLLARISAAQRAATATATIPKLIYVCLRSRVEHRGVDEAHRASRSRLVRASIHRSEERRVGHDCVRTCRSRWCLYHL